MLRQFTSVFFQAFDVASLNLLQLGISCQYTAKGDSFLQLHEFPETSERAHSAAQRTCTPTHPPHPHTSACSIGSHAPR